MQCSLSRGQTVAGQQAQAQEQSFAAAFAGALQAAPEQQRHPSLLVKQWGMGVRMALSAAGGTEVSREPCDEQLEGPHPCAGQKGCALHESTAELCAGGILRAVRRSSSRHIPPTRVPFSLQPASWDFTNQPLGTSCVPSVPCTATRRAGQLVCATVTAASTAPCRTHPRPPARVSTCWEKGELDWKVSWICRRQNAL